MKKTLLFMCLLFISLSAFSQVYANLTDENGVLKYYDGEISRDDPLTFEEIANFKSYNGVVGEVNFLRNEIFARYGRPFATHKYREYFQNSSWYITNPHYTDSLLTSADRESVARVLALEKMSPEAKTFLAALKNGTVLGDQEEGAFYDSKRNLLIVHWPIDTRSDQGVCSNHEIRIENYGRMNSGSNTRWAVYKNRLVLILYVSGIYIKSYYIVEQIKFDLDKRTFQLYDEITELMYKDSVGRGF